MKSWILITSIALVWALALVIPPTQADDAPPAQTAPITDAYYADNNCINCHRDLPGRFSEIVDLEWKNSVHYQAKVACDGCHGGDATLKADQFASREAFKKAAHLDRNPEFLRMHPSDDQFISKARGRSVSYFCGKCHAQIKEKHLGSPHGDFGAPTCLYCHGQGSHHITKATAALIDTRPRSENGRCSPCHKTSTMKAVAQIKKIVVDTEKRIETSGRRYQDLEQFGYRNLELEQLYHHAKQVHSQLRQIFHSFNMREINNFASEIKEIADRTNATYQLIAHLRHKQRQQTVIGVSVVAMLLLFAALLVYYKHVFLETHER